MTDPRPTSPRLALVKRIFQVVDLGENDVNLLFENITEDAEFTLTIEPGTPLSGTFRGREGYERYFARVAEVLEQNMHESLEFYESENGVAVLGRETFTVKKTGHKHENSHWVTIFGFEGDRISKVLVVENTAPLWDAYR